jgi:S1-C subfamily serine protease
MSAYSLPWTQPVEITVAQFRKALLAGQDAGVQQAMVWNLAQMRSPAAIETLQALFNDASQDPSLRARIAPELALADNPELARSLETAALSDPDPTVRNAAKAALVSLDPPATGYMITGTLPDSQAAAAGITTGDILISYGGKPTRDLDDLRAAAADATGQEQVPVVVVRDGVQVTIYLRPGQMGIYGKNVKAK